MMWRRELLNVQARRDAKVGINFPIDQIQYDPICQSICV